MCGIAGYFGKRQINEHLIKATLQALSHRGPDDNDVFYSKLSSNDYIYLIHTRLAIIDLDKNAKQPMQFQNDVLCFNGELYNYKECRDKIQKTHNIPFLTQSDTEVFLKMISLYGIKQAFEMAEGMWALAFFEGNSQTLYLARDRFAEKPLFYMETEHGIYFASELKALFSLLNDKPAVNYEKIKQYLFMGYRTLHQDSSTFFKDIYPLEGNSILSIQAGKIKNKEPGWDFSKKDEKFLLFNKEEIISSVRDHLFSAVELRLRSDVPIAFCMSGGIDSLSLISIAKKKFNYDVHGFTIKNLDARYDEKEYVDEAVNTLGIKHTYVAPEQGNFIENLLHMIKHRAAPVATISYYVHFLLMKEIHAHGYKVSISGTGADELFTGYYDHFLLHLAVVNEQAYQENLVNWEKHIKPIVRNPLYQDPALFKKRPYFRDHLHNDYSAHGKKDPPINFCETKYSDNLLRNRMLNELFKEVVPVILFEDDNNAMHFSIENRSPFLDSKLYEISNAIPSQFLIHHGYAKHILRESMKGILPEKVRLNRRKVGFNTSLHEVLPNDFCKNIDSFFDKSSAIFEFMERNKVIDMFKNKNPSEKFLFNFLNAKIFLDLYL